MIPNIEYFKRNRVVLQYEGDVRDDTNARVFDSLTKANYRPGFIMQVHNTIGFVHEATYLFDESVPCPAPEKLEALLVESSFVGDATIKRSTQEIWRKSFTR